MEPCSGVESARAMVWKAAYMKDAGQRNSEQMRSSFPGRPDLIHPLLSAAYYASIAKCLASEVAVRNAETAVQVFGGAGYNTECTRFCF